MEWFIGGIAFTLLLIVGMRYTHTHAQQVLAKQEAEDRRYEALRKEAEARDIQKAAIRLSHVWVQVDSAPQEDVKDLDETQPPNPFTDTFDAFDEWYIEEFSRIG